jgi:membrane protein implicated in regulation of membrane protease activity
MIVLGLLLVLAGLLVVLAALFSTDGTATMLGNELTALTIFLLGLVSGVAVLWGYAVAKFGARRTLQRRREHKQLTELSEKLERAETERREQDRDGEPRG